MTLNLIANSQDISLLITPNIDRNMVIASTVRNPAEMLKACQQALFPVCLGTALRIIFGENGSKFLNSIIMNETFPEIQIFTMNDVWKIYEEYLDRATNILGDKVVKVIQFQTCKEMERAYCPLYERALAKLIHAQS